MMMAPPRSSCCCSSRCLLPSTSLFFLACSSSRGRSRRGGARPPRLNPLLPLPVTSKSPPAASASSYNGWADLAAAPAPPLPLPLQSSTTRRLIILLPALALALALALPLSRLPPLPLLAAAFTAGFAARHLSSPQPQSPARIAADLDALRNQLLSADSDPGRLIQALDRLRDAVLDATSTTSHALPPVLGEVAHCFRTWVRHTLRDLSKKPKVAAAVPHNNSGVVAMGKGNKAAAAAAGGGGQAQQWDANKLSDSSVIPTALPFDNDDDEREDAVMSPQGKLGDARLERLLVFKHRLGRDRAQFQGASSSFATESMESSLLEIRDRSYRLRIQRRGSEAQDGAHEPFFGNAAASDPKDDESTATDSDCEDFSRNINEAGEILRKARECMMAMADEETADALLYKSARLLSTAVALRPTSLVAVGQLGNTYLLHGELKLKISRELRTLLANSGSFLNGRERVPRSRKVDRRLFSRENISSALVDVCEECESLLVEAGRSYRTALSIDSDDVKALYNWGLALIFRAQLLADIGPEAAVDADRVYLAAIDKFDAMLSKSNTYAPEALYRWGTALQQRSHLRPRNNKEKIRLLEQAKSLFEDVLYVEADNKMVREALSSCISELNYHGRWL